MKKLISVVVAVSFALIGIIGLSSWKHNESCSHHESGAWYTCDRCDGSKYDPVVKCRTCSGSTTITEKRPCRNQCSNGRVRDQYGNWQTCPLCGGTGQETMQVSCPTCNGWGHATCQKCHGSGQQWRD